MSINTPELRSQILKNLQNNFKTRRVNDKNGVIIIGKTKLGIQKMISKPPKHVG
jgi:hypothetical protein